MTELYLDGHRVVTENKDIKVTFENPFFSSSGQYTLEVSLPLRSSINQRFFASYDRLDVKKERKQYEARLIADNIEVLTGTATVTNVNESTVKLQLLGGNSALNFAATIEKVYIDEIDYGELDISPIKGDITKYTYGGVRKPDGELKKDQYARLLIQWDASSVAYCGNINQFMLMPVYDETNDTIKNYSGIYIGSTVFVQTGGVAVQPNLFYVIRKVVDHFGYSIRNNEIDAKPWNRIFIANARASLLMADALPHWSVKDFLKEVENLFNCTFVFDSKTKTVDIITNGNFFRNEIQAFPAEDIFSCELLDDDDDPDKSIASSNIKYDVSDSQEHLYDALSDEIRLGFEHKTYDTKSEMVTAITALPAVDRKKYIFDCPEGSFVWANDGDTTDDSDYEGFGPGRKDTSSTPSTNNEWYIKQVDQFGAIIRDDKSDEYIELKICPVAISTENKIPVFQKNNSGSQNHGDLYDKIAECTAQMPSMENQAGDDSSQKYNSCVWNAITGEDETKQEENKADRMEVFFVDDTIQYVNKDEVTDQSKKLPFPMAFTDYLDKVVKHEASGFQNTHEPWSMSLRKCGATYYIGQLHEGGIQFDAKAQMQISFKTDSVPDIRKLFMFRNKRYICSKFELNVTPNGIDKIIKGYFYELK